MPYNPTFFHDSLAPYIIASDASKVINFLKLAFDAKEIDRFETENSIMHAIVHIGDSKNMISDSNENMKPCLVFYICMFRTWMRFTKMHYWPLLLQ